MQKLLFIFVLALSSQFLQAQNAENIKLAQQFMLNGEYAKAQDLYEKIYDDNPSLNNYRQLYNCLLTMSEFKDAEKLISRHMKKNPGMLTLYADLGNVYKKQGDETRKIAAFEDGLKKITDNKSQVVMLANAFLGYDETQYAIKTYEQARRVVSDYSFSYELANMYFRISEFKLSMQTYLDYLAEPDANFQNVCNALSPMLDSEKNHTLLQETIYERIQKNDDPVFTELLIWDFTQLKDYEGAFIQVKALDKRLKENGKRVYDLGEVAKNEGEYDAAIKCYSYIIDTKGKDSPYYYAARSAVLKCRQLKIEKTNTYTQADINELENFYLQFINEYNRRDNKQADVITELAKLEAFYNHNVDSAIHLLEDVITWPSINMDTRSEIKLSLGDFYLFSGDVWEATLVYSQVDKAMKDEILGEEARFRNAKLSYYRGDFAAAQGQLDVLKAATSELVANDALELSVFITDNLGLDSVLEPMLLFSQADLYFYQNKIADAVNTLNTLAKKYPAHKLTDDIDYMRYKIDMKLNNTDSAIAHLEHIRQNFAFDLLADDAIFKLGDIYQYYKKDTEKAMACYQEIILNHKDSLYVNDARKRYRELRGDKLN